MEDNSAAQNVLHSSALMTPGTTYIYFQRKLSFQSYLFDLLRRHPAVFNQEIGTVRPKDLIKLAEPVLTISGVI